MLKIEKVDHVGIRISDKAASVAFYRELGFDLIADAGFDQGHPIIMRNKASGVTLNLNKTDGHISKRFFPWGS